jgi:hypothetical protein
MVCKQFRGITTTIGDEELHLCLEQPTRKPSNLLGTIVPAMRGTTRLSLSLRARLVIA